IEHAGIPFQLYVPLNPDHLRRFRHKTAGKVNNRNSVANFFDRPPGAGIIVRVHKVENAVAFYFLLAPAQQHREGRIYPHESSVRICQSYQIFRHHKHLFELLQILLNPSRYNQLNDAVCRELEESFLFLMKFMWLVVINIQASQNVALGITQGIAGIIEIGRASCRERVEISVVGGVVKKEEGDGEAGEIEEQCRK